MTLDEFVILISLVVLIVSYTVYKLSCKFVFLKYKEQKIGGKRK